MTYQKLEQSQFPTYIISLPEEIDTIFVEFSLPYGYFQAPKDQKEIPHLLEHYLLRSLTKKGLTISASTDVKCITFGAEFDRQHFSEQLSVFLETICRNALDDEAIFNREKNIVLNELAGKLDDPFVLSYRVSLNVRMEESPPFAVNLEEFENISLSDLKNFYKNDIAINQETLCIGVHSPDQDFHDIVIKISQIFNKNEKNSEKERVVPKDGFRSNEIVQYPTTFKRTYLNVTWSSAASLSDPMEQIAMMLILDILDDENRGLLWEVLRENHGLVYELDGRLDSYQNSGYFSLHFPLLSKDVEQCKQLALAQVERIKNLDYSESLFEELKKEYIESSREDWEDNEGRFFWIKTDILERANVYEFSQWNEYCQNIDREYLGKVAQKYLSEEQLKVVVLESVSRS